jgi:hypothetical protein
VFGTLVICTDTYARVTPGQVNAETVRRLPGA